MILEEGENCLEMCLLISGRYVYIMILWRLTSYSSCFHRVVFTADDEVWRSVAAGPQGYWFGEEGAAVA